MAGEGVRYPIPPCEVEVVTVEMVETETEVEAVQTLVVLDQVEEDDAGVKDEVAVVTNETDEVVDDGMVETIVEMVSVEDVIDIAEETEVVGLPGAGR